MVVACQLHKEPWSDITAGLQTGQSSRKVGMLRLTRGSCTLIFENFCATLLAVLGIAAGVSAVASGSVVGPIAVHTAHNIAALLYGGKLSGVMHFQTQGYAFNALSPSSAFCAAHFFDPSICAWFLEANL